MRIPEWVLSRLRATTDRAQQAQVGIEIARESLAGIKDLARHFPWIRGAYIMPAFNDARNALPILTGS